MKKVQKGSDNVFADLGVSNPKEAKAKAELARQIMKAIKAKKLTQAQAGKVLGIDQAKVSCLSRGRLSGFSTDRLFRFLNSLDQDVDIVITQKPKSRKAARLSVTTT